MRTATGIRTGLIVTSSGEGPGVVLTQIDDSASTYNGKYNMVQYTMTLERTTFYYNTAACSNAHALAPAK